MRLHRSVLAIAAALLLSAPVEGVTQKPVNAGQSRTGQAGDAIYQIDKVHKIHITISAAEWNVLQTSTPRNGGAVGGSDYTQPDGRIVHVGSGFGGYFPWAHADVRVDDPDFKAEFKNVGIRYKGNLSFQTSSAGAPLFASFKMKTDIYGGKGDWDDEKTFNLHAGVVDQSRMKEAAAYAIFRAAGVPASRTAYAELFFTVPGIYSNVSGGIYVMIEDVNKKFLSRVLPPGTGLLFKPEGMRGGISSQGTSWSQYVTAMRPDREATAHEQQRIMELGNVVSQPDVTLFRTKVPTYLDVDEFLRYIAVNAFIINNDSYIGGGHNFYVYLDPSDDKVRMIPWDQDLSMGGRGNSAQTGFDLMAPYRGDQPLIYWLLNDPAVMTQYRGIIRELSETAFSAGVIGKIMDAIEPLPRPNAPSPRSFLNGRAAYVQQLVAGWK